MRQRGVWARVDLGGDVAGVRPVCVRRRRPGRLGWTWLPLWDLPAGTSDGALVVVVVRRGLAWIVGTSEEG